MTRVYSREEVRSLPIRTRRPLGSFVSGEAKTRARGADGLDFAGFREYDAGDEVSRIDWSVTARLGRPWVRTYLEARGFPVLILADISASTRCMRGGATPSEIIGNLAARLASAATWSGCDTGLLMFADRVRQFIPLASGVDQLTRIVQALQGTQSQESGSTDVAAALDYVQRGRQRRSLIFLISDFLCADFADALSRCANRHEIVAISIEGIRDVEIPVCGLVNVRDPETSRDIQIDTSSPDARNALRHIFAECRARHGSAFRNAAVDYLELEASADYIGSVTAFLQQRGA
jgi:uncharacterized protein (DUF58 family)